MKKGRVWEYNDKKMCKIEKEFWADVFKKHAPLNLLSIYTVTGLTPTLVSKKIRGKAHLTVPQYETLKEYFDNIEPEWRGLGERY